MARLLRRMVGNERVLPPCSIMNLNKEKIERRWLDSLSECVDSSFYFLRFSKSKLTFLQWAVWLAWNLLLKICMKSSLVLVYVGLEAYMIWGDQMIRCVWEAVVTDRIESRECDQIPAHTLGFLLLGVRTIFPHFTLVLIVGVSW